MILNNPNLIILIISSYLPTLIKADSLLGCYSSIPSGYESQGTYTWQTSSYCSNLCGSSYDYFALTAGNECYCGNTAPVSDDIQDSSQCSTTCPGYPSEFCGSSEDYSVYAQADNVDASDIASSSGEHTSSSSPSTSPTTSPTTSSSSSPTTTPTTAATTSPTTSSTTSPTTSQDTTDTGNEVTTSPDTTSTRSILTSIVKESGTVVTSIIYVTPTTSKTSSTASSTGSSSSATSKKKSTSSNSKAAVIGGAVGGVLGGLLVIGLLIFFVCYRRRNEDDEFDDSAAADDLAYEEALKSNKNPFASPEDNYMSTANNHDKIMLGRRRLSDGSLADAADYDRKVLRVANPDDDLDY